MCELCAALNSGSAIISDDTVAILPVNSSAPAVMVVSKQHGSLAELPKQTQQHLFATANNMSSLIFDSMQIHGTNIIAHDGSHVACLIIARTE